MNCYMQVKTQGQNSGGNIPPFLVSLMNCIRTCSNFVMVDIGDKTK